MFFGNGFNTSGMNQRSNVDTSAYYKTLGVQKGETAAGIKKMYRKLAIKHHPDKGGDEHKFKEISEAYAVLSDPGKRERYDQFGKDGVDQDQVDPSSMFNMFFGGENRGQSGTGSTGSTKVRAKGIEVEVTLEELFNGVTKTISASVRRMQAPHGVDIKSSVSSCSACRGQGIVMRTRMVGPGMMQQSQERCEACSGAGTTMKNGVTIKTVNVKYTTKIVAGSQNQEQIRLVDKGDESPGKQRGDLVLVLKELPNDRFQRIGNDLVTTIECGFVDSICGLDTSSYSWTEATFGCTPKLAR